MRPTKTDRRMLWGMADRSGVVKAGNCDFAVVKGGTGAYSVKVPGGLPQPCAVLVMCLASITSYIYAYHISYPTRDTFNFSIVQSPGTFADADFYWLAIG